MTTPLPPVQNLVAEQADGNILLTWNPVVGAVSYEIYRSIDGVLFQTLVSSTPTVLTQYVDPYPGVGIMYWYQVAAQDNAGNTYAPSASAQMVAAPPSEMSLFELRLRAQETADRVNSDFFTTSELNSFIRLAMYELYDLLITAYEDYNIAPYAYINTTGSQGQYPLPDGVSNYQNGILYGPGTNSPAPAFYKLAGMDLAVNTSNNAWVTIKRYDWIDRNNFVYPNSTSTIYGVFNMRYRIMGQMLNLIPVPAGNQQLRLTYQPRLPALLQDTDLTTIGFSGWLRYAIVRVAKYMLDKEEGSDTSKLDAELLFLKTRIEQASQNRDIGAADTISETRKDTVYGGSGWGSGGGGGQGGW